MLTSISPGRPRRPYAARSSDGARLWQSVVPPATSVQRYPELDKIMKQSTLKSTTAILVVLSFGQPLPVIAQSGTSLGQDERRDQPLIVQGQPPAILPDAEAICAEDGITDAEACAILLRSLDAMAEDAGEPEGVDTPAPEDAAPALADTDTVDQTSEDPAAMAARQAQAEAEAQLAAEAQAAATADAAIEAEASATPAPDDAQTPPLAESDAPLATPAPEDATPAIADAEDPTPEDAAALAARQAQADTEAQAAADALAAEAAVATIAGSDTATEAPSDIMSEVVTEQQQRSSSEEFRDGNDGEAVAGADAPAATADTGLSDLERAGLLALGAVAVGAILLNGQRVQSRTGDRVIVVDEAGTPTVLKDDDALLRVPGAEVRTERFDDGSTRTEVLRDDGTRIVTVRDINGRALKRVRVDPDGREYVLIDDTREFAPVIVRNLPPPQRPVTTNQDETDQEALRLALLTAGRRDLGRSFSLRQVREIVEVRELALEINLGGITFETNSAAILPAQAERLREMGVLMRDLVRDNPTELFLVEGHTDAIGQAGFNLLLSDRRAESVALAFNEYFGVSAENMIVQGYGERFLAIQTQSAERANRRVAVRRITTLVRQD